MSEIMNDPLDPAGDQAITREALLRAREQDETQPEPRQQVRQISGFRTA